MSVRPRRVVFALFPGCEVMDVAGPLQAFHEAAAFGVAYEIVHAAATPTVRSAQGLDFAGLVPFPDVGPDDRVIVPGYTLADTRPPAALVAWVRRAAKAGAEICSVCTGTFVLGEAGVLDGRRCTTHWKRVRELQRRFPRATVVGDRLFVEDGPVTSSAGIASGIDMALALLARDRGSEHRATILLEERERHVDPRRDPRAAHHRTVLDEQPLADDVRAREATLQLAHALPVGGAAAPVEQPRFAEHEGAGAHRAHLCARCRRATHPRDELGRRPRVGEGVARDDHPVIRPDDGQRHEPGEVEALRRPHRRRRRRVHDLVRYAEPRCLVERLHRARHVHDLAPGKQREDDAAWPSAHAAISSARRGCGSADSSSTSVAVDTMRAKRRRSA
jgi:transcriptional regulator GlxA family with amidase domain